MRRVMKAIGTGLLVATLAASSSGFSLLGPYTTWQVSQIGYNLTVTDLGGPMALGEEYRLTVPLLTYGFDQSFLQFFGTNGVRAVEAAFQVLNDLPHVTAITDDYLLSTNCPLDSSGVNFTAQGMGILDLKSTVLGMVVAQMGLASPERYAWTLRSRTVTTTTPPATNYLVVRRNFDPITLAPSSFVNGTLYTYDIRQFDPPAVPQQFWDAVESPVDPQASTYTSVAGADDSGGGNFIANTVNTFALGLGSGEFLRGLTRDDIGGLRYLLRFNNFNIESLAPGVSNVVRSNGIFGPSGPSGLGLPSPYGPTFTGTNVVLNLTNSGTNAIIVGLRPGIGKVSFQKLDFDSFLYTVVSRPVTNTFIDVVITNSIVTNQLVQRIITFPDILFTASDLGVVGTTAIPFRYARTLVQGRWINNAGTNFITGTGPVVAPGGPGVIPPTTAAGGGGAGAGIIFTFSTLTPSFVNSTTNSFFQNEGTATPSLSWGYFDQSTIFAIFPTNTTLQELEALVLRP